MEGEPEEVGARAPEHESNDRLTVLGVELSEDMALKLVVHAHSNETRQEVLLNLLVNLNEQLRLVGQEVLQDPVHRLVHLDLDLLVGGLALNEV